MRLAILNIVLVISMMPLASISARFELVKEWTAGSSGYPQRPNPSRRFPDGSQYIRDHSEDAPYPIWRLLGNELQPMTGISHEEVPAGSVSFYPLQDWALMIVNDGEVISHWRMDEQTVVPLEPIWGPIPTTEIRLILSLSEGIIFSGVHPDSGRELWLMDKTGYHLIRDVNPGPADSHPSFVSLTPHVGGTSDYRLFRLDDGTTGLEPWVYRDGTLGFLADLQAGAEGSWPLRLGVRGDDIYFWGNYHRIFKFDGETASLIIQSSGLAEGGSPSAGYFLSEGDLYTWRADCCGWSSYVGRILPDDTVERLKTFFPPFDLLEVHSVVPWNGAIETQGPNNNETWKVSTELPVPSRIFRPWAKIPIVRKYSESELLFQETDYYENKGHVYCLAGEKGRAMWRGQLDGYARADVNDSVDWIYLSFTNNAGQLGEPGGLTQLWAMKWPEGCQDAWPDEVIHSSGFEGVSD